MSDLKKNYTKRMMRRLKAQLMDMFSGKRQTPLDSIVLSDSATCPGIPTANLGKMSRDVEDTLFFGIATIMLRAVGKMMMWRCLHDGATTLTFIVEVC